MPPMHLIPVPALLTLDRLHAHQFLLESGCLVLYREVHFQRVIFVSHQWLGYLHPDPVGDHLQALQRILSRLARGDINKVESHQSRELASTEKTVVRRVQWVRALPHMYCWLDFLALPSLASHGAAAQDCVKIAKPGGRVQNSVSSDVARALPVYVERSALILVLAPVCEHCDTRMVCNFATWRTRGWCRMELLAAVLARTQVRVLVCTGESAAPFFLHTEPQSLLLGAGEFSCCARGMCDWGSRACDKARLREVLESMICAKVAHLAAQGRVTDQQTLASLQHYLLQGLTCGQLAPAQREACVPKVAESGMRRLPFAVMADNVQATSEILEHGHFHPDQALWSGSGLVGFSDVASPLMLAMRFANFGVVKLLLAASAEPNFAVSGRDALMCAAVAGDKEGNVRAWLQRFPRWDLEREERTSGSTALSLAAGVGPGKGGVVEALLAAGANPRHVDGSGALPLYAAAAKADSDPETVRLLIEVAPDTVNEPVVKVGRGCLCSTSTMCLGRTPLHAAMARGDVRVVSLLLEARADLSLRNAEGATPTELAQATFGGKLPPALARLLSQEREPALDPPSKLFSVPGPPPQLPAPSPPVGLQQPLCEPRLLPGASTRTLRPLVSQSSLLSHRGDSAIPEARLDTFGDTLAPWASESDGADRGGCSAMSCVQGPLGVSSLSIAKDSLIVQTSALSKTWSSRRAIHGENMTWVRGEELGCGSLGRVFSALDQKTGQVFAVKEVAIEESLNSDLRFKAALEHEIGILQHLEHPRIVLYLGHDYIDRCLYIYLEYMPGGSLAQLLSQFGALDNSLIAVYTRQLLEGLEYLHTRDPPVIHRDIKGPNVLVGLDCKVKLSDFGCSKRTQETLCHTMKGSVPWMAPEVLQNAGYGLAADIWSLGCVVIEMATGTRPWAAIDNPMAAMVRIAMTEETPPVPPGLAEVTKDFLGCCLRRKAQLRLSATALLLHPFVAASELDPSRNGDYLDASLAFGSLKETLPNCLE